MYTLFIVLLAVIFRNIEKKAQRYRKSINATKSWIAFLTKQIQMQTTEKRRQFYYISTLLFLSLSSEDDDFVPAIFE